MEISLPNTSPSFWEILRALPIFLQFLKSVDKWRFWAMFIDGAIRGLLSWGLVMALNSLAQVLQQPISLNQVYLWTFLAVIISGILALLNSISLVIRDVFRHKIEVALNQLNMNKMMKVSLSTLENAQFQSLAHLYQQYKKWMMDLIMAFTGIVYEGLEVLGILVGIWVFPWQVMVVVILSLVIKFSLGSQVGVSSWTLMNVQSRRGLRALYYSDIFNHVPTAMEARLFGFAKTFSSRWNKHIDALLKERMRVTWHSGIALSIGDAIQIIGLLLGCYLILSSGQALIVVSIMPFIVSYQRFQSVGSRFFGDCLWFLECAPMLFVFRNFQAIPEVTEKSVNSSVLMRKPLTITFEDVCFRYPNSEQDALHGLNFHFVEGEKLALVGSNGAGKSTLVKLLLGLYEPTSGHILINNIPLQTISLQQWRSMLSVMFQQVSSYDDTIKEQVHYGSLGTEFDEKRFTKVLKVSGASSFVTDLPRGAETHIGKEYSMPEDQGVELSGGQRQMLAIARALYRKARFYIFDEPTSAVDAEKEENFFAALPDAVGNAGLLFISHRFSTLRRAQKILVMESGKIIESGSHDQLLKQKGRYHELFSLQAKMYN
ncbi:MAG: ABC transporter ATP-binding protein [Candidatus Abawacabacteria bacterium]|nr:ABC transporter ATP-binding protein [Candidatus Abawacabacteria bacterium]